MKVYRSWDTAPSFKNMMRVFDRAMIVCRETKIQDPAQLVSRAMMEINMSLEEPELQVVTKWVRQWAENGQKVLF